jgi:hypothetical protein
MAEHVVRTMLDSKVIEDTRLDFTWFKNDHWSLNIGILTANVVIFKRELRFAKMTSFERSTLQCCGSLHVYQRVDWECENRIRIHTYGGWLRNPAPPKGYKIMGGITTVFNWWFGFRWPIHSINKLNGTWHDRPAWSVWSLSTICRSFSERGNSA